MTVFFVDLQRFAEGGAAAEGTAAPEQASGGKNPLASVRYGKQPEDFAPAEDAAKKSDTIVEADSSAARTAEFEKLIKGQYKAEFDARTQKIINERFKHTKELEQQAGKVKELAPLLDMLAGKYGVDGSDVSALVKAVTEDDSYYEQEAMDKGLSVEQLKHIKQIERENAAFKRAAQDRERQASADRIYAQWQQQSDTTKQIYPGFDLQAETGHPETGQRFLSLLKSGVDVQTAYEVIHKDELITHAMYTTAQAVESKVVNDIRARGLRPQENGGSGSGAFVTKKDPKTFTKKDRDEISRRVLRGERIEL